MNTMTALVVLYVGAGFAWAIKIAKDVIKYIADCGADTNDNDALFAGMKLGANLDEIPRALTIMFFPMVFIVGLTMIMLGQLIDCKGRVQEWFKITFNSKQELEDFKKYTQMVCTDLVQFTSYGRIMTENDKNYLLGVIDVLNSKKEFIRKVEKKTKSEKRFDFDFMENTIRSTLKFHGWDA